MGKTIRIFRSERARYSEKGLREPRAYQPRSACKLFLRTRRYRTVTDGLLSAESASFREQGWNREASSFAPYNEERSFFIFSSLRVFSDGDHGYGPPRWRGKISAFYGKGCFWKPAFSDRAKNDVSLKWGDVLKARILYPARINVSIKLSLLSRFGSAGVVPGTRKPKSFYRRKKLW